MIQAIKIYIYITLCECAVGYMQIKNMQTLYEELGDN